MSERPLLSVQSKAYRFGNILQAASQCRAAYTDAWDPVVIMGVWAFSCERGTPVASPFRGWASTLELPRPSSVYFLFCKATLGCRVRKASGAPPPPFKHALPRLRGLFVQGYLAHKKAPTPLGPPWTLT